MGDNLTIDKSVLNEAKVANSFVKFIKLDQVQLEYYEKQLHKLNLATSMAKDMKTLEIVDTQFDDLKNKIEMVLSNYKNAGLANELGSLNKSVGEYIGEMECEYYIAKLTHQSFNIPTIVSRLIGLESFKEKLEYKLNIEKTVGFDPKKKWELSRSKEFVIRQEVSKMKQTLNGQEEFVDKTVKNVFAKAENEEFDSQMNKHFSGINVLTKKLYNMSKTFEEAVITPDNIIGITVTAAMINNLLRGIKKLVKLSNVNEYINENTLIEELEYHLDDYTLIRSITNDSVKQIEEIKKSINEDFGMLAKRNEFGKQINSDLIQSKGILCSKEEKIVDKNKILKKNNFNNYLN